MRMFVYDGSFEGLLTAVYEAYYAERMPELIVTMAEFEMNFLYEEIHIQTDALKYRKVENAIRNKISELALEHIYHAFLSELPGISTRILDYIRLGFKTGAAITGQHTVDIVKKVQDAALKTSRETHLLTGLVRFKRISGDVYYTSIEPDHNVVTLLAPHFQDRLSDQQWIIHDLKRDIAAVYDLNGWVLQTGLQALAYNDSNEDQASLSKSSLISEDSTGYLCPAVPENRRTYRVRSIFNASALKDADFDYEALWRLYHKHISIETKRNIKLQKQHMPYRYWQHMPEKLPYSKADMVRKLTQ